MTELEILAFIVLPLGIAMIAWAAVLIRERRARNRMSPASARGRQ
jgi:hypothetical protein